MACCSVRELRKIPLETQKMQAMIFPAFYGRGESLCRHSIWALLV
jgi:hypothetical protein